MTTANNPPVAVLRHFRRAPKRLKVALVVLTSIEIGSAGLQAQGRPEGGVVRAGAARIVNEATSTRIEQISDRAIIDWRSFGIGAGEQVVFVQPSALSATLNRVTGEQASVILGRLDANGQVLLINPNGVVFGAGAEVNVGSLIASTSNITDANFMTGRLVFDEPGRPGAGVFNAGRLTAAEGGLIALVAPHVRNDGIIVARLGRVTLGAADSFTIDLYGDDLINLALSDVHAGQLRDTNGEPIGSLITQKGQIDTAGGRTVLITARNAVNVLDSLINMSGTIKADTAVQQGGRILLLGEGGKVDVSGSLSAQGATGGTVQVLGDQVRVAAGASLDASGAAGGGTVHVGGAYQGQGDTYRSVQTTVDAGASLKANATTAGNGGDVVVWSDGQTTFAGLVEAKGGATGGDGGRLEVSGKGTLAFLGHGDASAAAGQAGSLLLDPTYLDVNEFEAALLTRVLRTGTSTTLAADIDINVNSAIYGGDRIAGGGLTMNAGNNINVNDFVVTNNGAINLTAATGTVNVAAGKALFAGDAPISINANGDLRTSSLVTNGSLAIRSIAGSVAIDAFIDGHTGPVSIRAARDIDINQPIVNMASGDGLDVVAGQDINVNAQVDGRDGVQGGAVTMTASRNLNVNDSIVTNNGAVALTATGGAVKVAAGEVVVAGNAPIAINARGDVVAGASSSRELTISSATGSVAVNGIIDAATGTARVTAATDVNINQPIANGQTGSALFVNAGQDINVNAQVDGRGGVAGGAVTMTAARNLNVNQSVLTNNGAIGLTAASGAATFAAGQGVFSGAAPIAMRSAGDLTTGAVNGGSLAATSTGGSVRVNGVIDGNTGRVDLSAARDVTISQPVLNLRTGNALNVNAGQDVRVNAQVDGRGGATGGTVTLTGGRDVAVTSAIATNNGAINITATGGSAAMAPAGSLSAGNGAITVSASRDITTAGVAGGSLSANARNGSVNVNGVIDGSTGRVDLRAGGDVVVNQSVLNARSGAALSASAGRDVAVNAPIDGTGGRSGGSVALAAGRDVTINSTIATNRGAIDITATGGAASMTAGSALSAASAPITISAAGNVSTGAMTGGSLSATSSGASVLVNGVIDGSTGNVNLRAARDVAINQPVLNLRSGASMIATAGQDVTVNALIDGRGGVPGGGVTLAATRNVNINQSVLTNDGAIAVTATNGTMTFALGQGLFAGTDAITLRSAGDLTTGVLTGGSIDARSTAGSLTLNGPTDGRTGSITLAAATDVTVNQPVLMGSAFAATAGQDVTVNAQLDGRLGPSGGTVALTATRNVAVNDSIVTNNGAIAMTASTGTVTASPTSTLASGSGAITLNAAGDVTTGPVAGGSLAATSSGASVIVAGVIDASTGAVNLTAARDVTINQPALNLRSGASLTATAGQDVNVNAQIDGSGGTAGGSATLSATRNVNLTQSILTNNGAVTVSATNGTVAFASGQGLFAGTGAISVDALGDLSTGALTGGPVTVTSRGGAVIAGGVITGSGAMTISAAEQVDIDNAIANPGAASALTVTAGTDINVNAGVGRTAPGTASGSVTMTAANDINLNDSIVTEDAAIALTATAGTVTTAANEGLFAGTGNIAVQSGGTLTTGILSTTGTLALTSTGGSINLENAIAGETGAVTLSADVDVNLNEAIANPRSDAPLSITAGNDINVNAGIDGTDDVLTGSSGTVTLTAGNDINLDESIVTRDSAINLTATGGVIAAAAGKGPFAGSGAIALTSGGTLDLGTFATTGTLALRSTSAAVNVDTAIPDTTGAVTINAATDVNVNESITNLKTGSNLTVTAGNDINVLAPIDGRNGVAGGTVTMTAGNDIGLTESIATNNGAVTLTATAGSITVPVGVQVVAPVFSPELNATVDQITTPMEAIIVAGTAPVSLTSGDNFSLRSPVATSGALTITSTNGDVTIAAPISDNTGAVTITAGDALIVNHQIKSNDQAITLNAGAGGITVNEITDYDWTVTSPVNPRNANLTLNSVGDVSILDDRGIASLKTVTIDTRGQIITGKIGDAVKTNLNLPTRPEAVVLNADGGIVGFSTGYAGSVTATSSGGTINLTVGAPGKLRITTGTPGTLDCPTCDINLFSSAIGGNIGPDVVLNAGGTVNLPDLRSVNLTAIARSGDVNFKQAVLDTVTATAGRDVNLTEILWVGSSPYQSPSGGPVSLTAGRDIVTTALSPIHISNYQTLTMIAARNVTLNLLESLGAVNITATTGNITLNNDIGPHIIDTDPLVPDFNPDDKGVASLTMSAGGAITMQGARAQGNVVISSGGNLTAAKQITSVNGTVTLTTGGTQSLSNVPIGNQTQLEYPTIIAPVVAPGPRAPLPTGPGVASAGAAGAPAFAEINVAISDQQLGPAGPPSAASGAASIPGAPGGAGAPGSASGSVGVGSASGSVSVSAANAGTTAPGRTGSAVSPGGPAGGSTPNAGSSGAVGTDTASALRAAGPACGEPAETDDATGLTAATQEEKEGADPKAAACPSVEPATQAAAAAPAAPGAPADPTAPTGTGATATAPTPPIGGGLQ